MMKKHKWVCRPIDAPDIEEVIKATSIDVARNIYAKRNGIDPRAVIVKRKD